MKKGDKRNRPLCHRISAIILSAGLSSRMGVMKALLPVGDFRACEHIIRTFLGSGVQDIIIVTGHEKELLSGILRKYPVREIFNPDYRDGMLSSVKAGISNLNHHTEAFFLQPVDIPLVRVSTIQKMIAVFQESETTVVHPLHQGQKGHPPLISARLKEAVLTWDGPSGLKGLLDRYEKTSVKVETDDPGILWDMDTPEDYRNIKEKL